MKKRFFYWMFVAIAAMSVSLVSLTSCSKDDDKTEEPNNLVAQTKKAIVGKWLYLGDFTETGKQVASGTGDFFYLFKDDGTYDEIKGDAVQATNKWDLTFEDGALQLSTNVKRRIRRVNEEYLEYYFPGLDGQYARCKRQK